MRHTSASGDGHVFGIVMSVIIFIAIALMAYRASGTSLDKLAYRISRAVHAAR